MSRRQGGFKLDGAVDLATLPIPDGPAPGAPSADGVADLPIWEHRYMLQKSMRDPNLTPAERSGAGAELVALDPSRVAICGDWHANTRYATDAIRYAAQQGAELIVHCGDFGYDFPATFVRNVTKALRRHGIPLMFVDGNHESFDLLYRYPLRDNGLREVSDMIWHIPRGHRWSWGGVSFLGCGGAHSVDRPWREPGTSWWWQERITDADVDRCAAGGRVDVLISHDCPAGVVIPGIDDRVLPPPFPPAEIEAANQHRQVLRRVVDAARPSVIWHGHYHVDYAAGVDFGYGPVVVRGLGADGGVLGRNVQVVDVAKLWGDAR